MAGAGRRKEGIKRGKRRPRGKKRRRNELGIRD